MRREEELCWMLVDKGLVTGLVGQHLEVGVNTGTKISH